MISVPQDAAEVLLGVEEGGSTLPKYIPTFYWGNGNPQLKESHPVLYHGGWKTDKETFDQIISGYGKPYPPVLEEFTGISDSNTSYDVYGSRHIFVMPIKYVKLWGVMDDSDRIKLSKEYTDGSRSDLRWLSLFADKVGDEYIPWGPVILKARGLQSQNIVNAVQSWKKYTASARDILTTQLREAGKWTDSKPISEKWFWMPIGTFGKEPNFQRVGSGNKTSLVSPIVTYTGESAMNPKVLETLYVGEKALVEAAHMLDETKEWFDRWDDDAVGVEEKETVEAPPVDGDGIPW